MTANGIICYRKIVNWLKLNEIAKILQLSLAYLILFVETNCLSLKMCEVRLWQVLLYLRKPMRTNRKYRNLVEAVCSRWLQGTNLFQCNLHHHFSLNFSVSLFCFVTNQLKAGWLDLSIKNIVIPPKSESSPT